MRQTLENEDAAEIVTTPGYMHCIADLCCMCTITDQSMCTTACLPQHHEPEQGGLNPTKDGHVSACLCRGVLHRAQPCEAQHTPRTTPCMAHQSEPSQHCKSQRAIGMHARHFAPHLLDHTRPRQTSTPARINAPRSTAHTMSHMLFAHHPPATPMTHDARSASSAAHSKNRHTDPIKPARKPTPAPHPPPYSARPLLPPQSPILPHPSCPHPSPPQSAHRSATLRAAASSSAPLSAFSSSACTRCTWATASAPCLRATKTEGGQEEVGGVGWCEKISNLFKGLRMRLWGGDA